MIVFITVGTTLTGFVEALLSRSGSHVSLGHKVGIILATTFSMVVLQYCVGAFVRLISSSGDGTNPALVDPTRPSTKPGMAVGVRPRG
jgi:hypothetical protein